MWLKHKIYRRLTIVLLLSTIVVLATVSLLAVVLENKKVNWLRNLISETSPVTSPNAEPSSLSEDLALIANLLGFPQARTYLILFQNNTELRPSGGFIGMYGVLEFKRGKIKVLVMEGTEQFDGRTDQYSDIPPPPALAKYLGVKKWFFRDSNWSPDFSSSAKYSLDTYRVQGGVAANDIDTVIAFTPTVLERLLAIVGPVTVDDITFNPENVIEKLEYEVEFAYKEKAIPKSERKEIIKRFMIELINLVQANLLVQGDVYFELFKSAAAEKHILFYSADKKLAEIIEENKWDSRVPTTTYDYLLWVDANLNALKTDNAMERHIFYQLAQEPGRHDFIATTTMRYTHSGEFDWRTTRYRTYARLFVPKGSILLSTKLTDEKGNVFPLNPIEQGEELEKQWFGTFIVVLPQDKRELSFTYRLPVDIKQKFEQGLYSLYVQKQSGTIAHGLTLELDFDKTIIAARPEVIPSTVGDNQYQYETDLRVDRLFEVQFTPRQLTINN